MLDPTVAFLPRVPLPESDPWLRYSFVDLTWFCRDVRWAELRELLLRPMVRSGADHSLLIDGTIHSLLLVCVLAA